MEIGLIVVAILVMIVAGWQTVRTRETLLDMIQLVGETRKSLDSLSVSVHNLAEVEGRIARKEESRAARDRLAEVREGGWKGV